MKGNKVIGKKVYKFKKLKLYEETTIIKKKTKRKGKETRRRREEENKKSNSGLSARVITTLRETHCEDVASILLRAFSLKLPPARSV